MRRLHLLATMLPIVCLAAPAAAENYDETVHKEFEVGAGARLQLESGDGDVTIVAWDQPRISIDVVYRADWKKAALTSEVHGPSFTLEQEGDLVRAHGEEPGASGTIGFSWFTVQEYTWEIRVPERCAIDVRGEDGELKIGGITGELRVQSEDGDVDLDSISSSEAHVRAEDGSLKAVECAGDWVLRVEDGDVELVDHRAGPLEIRAADGDVEVSLVPGDRLACDVEAEDGDVEIRLAAGIGADVRVRTDDGRIHVPEGFEVDSDREGATGVIGDGSGMLKIRTEDGSATVRVD